MLLCGTEDGAYPRRPATVKIMLVIVNAHPNEANSLSPTEQDSHDKCMGESNFDTVHETIACTFYNCKIVVICRISEDGGQSRHCERGFLVEEEEGERFWDGGLMESFWPCAATRWLCSGPVP